MQSIFLFLDLGKFSDFWYKIADVSTTQVVYHMTHIVFRSSLGKV